jgi:hypothetical protein
MDTAFDGTWSVTVDFHAYQNPDGSVARAWVKHFRASVRERFWALDAVLDKIVAGTEAMRGKIARFSENI